MSDENQYIEEIRGWNWDYIKAQALTNEQDQDGVRWAWLGSVYALTPSGKVYALWTTNQTQTDVDQDTLWFEALEAVADEHGMFLGSPDWGETDHIYVGINNDDAD